MQTLKRVFNSIHWRPWVIVLLASVVVWTSTACSTSRAAAPVNPNTALNQTERSEGMYPYKDTDLDTRAADAKADRLIRQAQQRTQKVNNPQDWLDEVTPDQSLGEQAKDVGQSARQAAENIGQSTQRAAEKAVDKTQKGLKDLGQNAKDVVDGAANAVDQVTPNRPNG